MAITALPTPPSRQDPTNFAQRADDFLGALPTFATEANALQADVNAKQVTASAAADSAIQASNVSAWVSGTTYAIGDNTFDPVTFLTYRRKTAGAGTTRPALDTTNWQLITGQGEVDLASTQTLSNKSFDTRTVFSSTDSIKVPAGTTAQRPAGAAGDIRYNVTLTQFEGYNGSAWGAIGGGATGSPGNAVFYENDQTITGNYTIPTGKNAHSTGPITVSDGVTVTVSDGSRWVIS